MAKENLTGMIFYTKVTRTSENNDVIKIKEHEEQTDMEITLTKIPNTSKKQVKVQWRQLSSETIEMLIAELYRSDSITFKEAQSLLGGASWQDTSAMLEKHGCTLYYDRDDFEQDLETLNVSETHKTT